MVSGVRRVVVLGVVTAAAVVVAACGSVARSQQVATGGVPTTPLPPSSPTTTSTSTTTTIPAPRTLSVLLTGDILTERPVLETAAAAAAGTANRYDFMPLFAPIAPLVQSVDLAICQMELPVGRPGEEPGTKGRSPFGGNRLLAPYEIVPALGAAGFDRCTTASNHSYDVGDAGIDSTIDAFEGVGISWSGTARRPEELPPPVLTVGNVRVAHLSYTRRSNTPWPADRWRLAYTDDPAAVAQDVLAARAAGADVVIVSIHVFKELTQEPIAENRAFAEAITALADVDAVVHHGPHVVQGVEVVNGTPVWWSIGNLLSGMARPGAADRYTDPRTRDGLGAVLHFTETSPGVWTTTWSSIVLCNEQRSRVIHAGVAALQDPALQDPDLRAELEGCVERTRAAVPDAG